MPLNTIPNKGLTSRGYPSDRLVTPIIINGDMQVAQRGAGPSGTFAGSGYSEGPDRFRHGIANLGTWQTSQSTDVPTGQGFSKSFKIALQSTDTSLGADDEAAINYRIEGQNVQSLKKGTSNAESVTLAFWVKSTKTGTYIAEIFDADNSRTINKAYTISSANTWEKKVISYEGDTTGTLDNDNARSLQLNFWLGAGANAQSGTLQTTWGTNTFANRAVGQVNLADTASAEWYITGLQLEVGEFDSTTIPSFPFESFESNLRRCARYYQKVLDGSESSDASFENFTSYNGPSVYSSHIYPMGEMRTAPSGVSSNNNNDFKFWTSGNAHYADSVSFDHISKRGAWIYTTMKTSVTQGFSLFSAAEQTTTRCAFDAEL